MEETANRCLLCVAVQRVLFAVVWVTTFGKHHFWLLPNLTEDVGFFESFKPFYKHDVCSSKDKDKASGSDGSGAASDDGVKDQEDEGVNGDNDNGYEMVDREEVAHVEDVALGVGVEETKKTK